MATASLEQANGLLKEFKKDYIESDKKISGLTPLERWAIIAFTKWLLENYEVVRR